MSFDYDTLPMPPVSESVGSSVVNASYGGLEVSEHPQMEDYFFVDFDNIEEPPQVIEGILHEGCKMVIGGSSKSRKSWFATQLAVSVSHGRDFMGHEVEKVPVCYINLEVPKFTMKKRVRQVLKAMDLAMEEGQLQVVDGRGKWKDISSLEFQIPVLVEKEVKLIVIDPVYKLSLLDENNTKEVGLLLRALDRLVEVTGAALVFVHHYRKSGGGKSMDRLSGSGLIARDFDSMLGIDWEQTGDKLHDTGTLKATLRNHPPLGDIPVRWEHPLIVRDDSDSPFVSHNASKKHFPQDILAHMRPGVEYRSGNLREATGMGRTVFSQNLKVLVDDGRVVSPRRGFYKLPEEESNEEE